MAAAAAAFTKTRRHLLHSLWNKNTTVNSLYSAPHQLHRRKWCSHRRLIKEVELLSTPTTTTTVKFVSSYSSRASPSSTSSQKSGLVAWYSGLINTRPILTKSITAALIYAAADVSSQTIMRESTDEYDLVRTLRMAGYGMVILGPSLHFWYNFVSRTFPRRDLLSTTKKIVLGQTTFGPAMTTIFYSFNAASQGETGSEIFARLKRDLLPTMINGVMYWPFCDFIVFKFTPVHLQPLVTNSFSYLWTVYMTYMASLEKVTTS